MRVESGRVLVIDEQPQLGRRLCDHLARQGFDVRTAATVADALAQGAAWVPHVVVADGDARDRLEWVEFEEHLRGENPQVQTILVSSTATQRQTDRSEFFACFEHPYRMDEMSRTVQFAMRKSLGSQPVRVLVLSPSMIVRQAASEVLSAAGVPHVTASDDEPSVAVGLLQEHSDVNVVLLDCHQPSLHQQLLGQRLREERPDLVVVGSSEEGGPEAFARIGVEHYISRFCETGELVAAVTLAAVS